MLTSGLPGAVTAPGSRVEAGPTAALSLAIHGDWTGHAESSQE